MARNPKHAMLARPGHDDRARLGFIGALKLHAGRRLRPANRAFFERDAAPAFAAQHGHRPEKREEIAAAMRSEPHWQLWSCLNRATQEQMWATVSDVLDRDAPRLQQAWESLTSAPDKRGSLELDPDCAVPEALRQVEIHLQPGGYLLDRDAADFRAGALYEFGGAVYSAAQGVSTRESKAEIILRLLRERFPGFRPARMLDMGCSAGSSSTPYAEAWPDTEVHAIDVAPGLLRYAHARAEALGVAVHFHQRNVADTKFPDAHFDLVVSHNAMHEMSADDVAAMLRESWRLLRPGGICVHQDVPLRNADLDAYQQFDFGWDRDYNGEPFWESYAELDLEPLLLAAGFPEDAIETGFVPQADGRFHWYYGLARKPEPGA